MWAFKDYFTEFYVELTPSKLQHPQLTSSNLCHFLQISVVHFSQSKTNTVLSFFMTGNLLHLFNVYLFVTQLSSPREISVVQVPTPALRERPLPWSGPDPVSVPVPEPLLMHHR